MMYHWIMELEWSDVSGIKEDAPEETPSLSFIEFAILIAVIAVVALFALAVLG